MTFLLFLSQSSVDFLANHPNPDPQPTELLGRCSRTAKNHNPTSSFLFPQRLLHSSPPLLLQKKKKKSKQTGRFASSLLLMPDSLFLFVVSVSVDSKTRRRKTKAKEKKKIETQVSFEAVMEEDNGASGVLSIEQIVGNSTSAIEMDSTMKQFQQKDEFIYIENFFSEETVKNLFLPIVEENKQYIHRNYIPFHKKGGTSHLHQIFLLCSFFHIPFSFCVFLSSELLTSNRKHLILHYLSKGDIVLGLV